MLTAGMPTDKVNLRNFDINTLLRLFDQAKHARYSVQGCEMRVRAQRTYNRVVGELRRRGLSA